MNVVYRGLTTTIRAGIIPPEQQLCGNSDCMNYGREIDFRHKIYEVGGSMYCSLFCLHSDMVRKDLRVDHRAYTDFITMQTLEELTRLRQSVDYVTQRENAVRSNMYTKLKREMSELKEECRQMILCAPGGAHSIEAWVALEEQKIKNELSCLYVPQ